MESTVGINFMFHPCSQRSVKEFPSQIYQSFFLTRNCLSASLTLSAVVLDVVAITALIINGTRVGLGYKQTWDRYQLLVNKTLYEKTLASGFGAVHFLIASVQMASTVVMQILMTIIISLGVIGNVPVMFCKPQTCMNACGGVYVRRLKLNMVAVAGVEDRVIGRQRTQTSAVVGAGSSSVLPPRSNVFPDELTLSFRSAR